MSDVNKIDTFIIKSLQKDFYNESVNFNNSTYRTFSSSYIRNCSDVYVQRMNNTLNSLYVKIRDGYSNINKWWTNYNENISELEISLSNDVNGGQITESAVRSYVNSLPKLETYNIKNMGSISKAVAGVIETATFVNNNVVVGADMFSNLYTEYNSVNVEKTVSNEVTDFFSDVGTVVSGTAKSIWTKVKGWGNNVKNWWEKDAVPFFKTAVSKSCDVLKSTGATVVTFAQSLTEGVLKFGESIVDFLAIAGTGVGSIFTGAYDLGKAIGCKMYGVEYKSTTSSMWKDTMGFVSKDYVGGWFNKLYDNTTYGKWLKENAYFFDGTRSVGSGIGYIAGVVALTIATFGVGSVVSAGGGVTVTTAAAATTTAKTAIVAGLAGMGKGTEKAWAEGAGIGKGLVAGTLTGAWEGLQFWVGGKISEATLGGSKILTKMLGQKNSWSAISNSKILNRVFRVGLDSADGGVEGFIQPLIESIYKTEYLDSEGNYTEYNKNYFKRVGEVFTTTGGFKNVVVQTLVGGIGSTVGETFDLVKFFKKNPKDYADVKIDTNVDAGIDMKVDAGIDMKVDAKIDMGIPDLPEKLDQKIPIIEDITENGTVDYASFPIVFRENTIRIEDVDSSSYYSIVYEKNGERITKDILSPILETNKKTGMYLSLDDEMKDSINNGTFKIISIEKNQRKTSLVLGASSGLQKGLNIVTFLVDGKKQTEIFSKSNVDLNEIIKDTSDFKILNIENRPSYNINNIDENSICKLEYEVNNKKHVYYMMPERDFFAGNFNMNVDKYIMDNKLFNVENVNAVIINKADLDISNLNFNDYKNSDMIFNVKKYGGNQSDTPKLFLKQSPTGIEKAKLNDLINVIKKKFPDATDVECYNLSTAYEQVGCGYMGISNSILSFFADKDLPNEFYNRFGYYMAYQDGNVFDMNFEPLAMDLFLHFVDDTDINDAISHASGISAATISSEKMSDFFSQRGMKINAQTITDGGKPIQTDRIADSFVTSKQNGGYSMLLANDFDLFNLSSLSAESTDAALLNAIQKDGKISGIGSHAMLITEITENKDVIVSSWSNKFKYMSDSTKKFAIVLNMVFDFID